MFSQNVQSSDVGKINWNSRHRLVVISSQVSMISRNFNENPMGRNSYTLSLYLVFTYGSIKNITEIV